MEISFSQLAACTEQNKLNMIFDQRADVWNTLIFDYRGACYLQNSSFFRYADYVSLMSFDYHTATSDPVTGINSPLYEPPGGNPNNTALNTVSIFHQSTFFRFLFIKNHFINQMYVASFPTA